MHMRLHPLDDVPELAGLATYAGAARVGYSVDDNVRRLLRFHWVERQLMATMIAHLTAEPVWEVKCALALHQWQCAEHVDALRGRIAEMRNPVPRLDVSPDPALESFLDEMRRSTHTAELLAGIYEITYAALAEAYRTHLERTNPLVDQPTCRILRFALADIDEALAWGSRALDAVETAEPGARRGAERWAAHLSAYLAAIGGIGGDEPAGATQELEFDRTRDETPFEPNFHPRRDERFKESYDFEFPPHVV